MNTWRLYRHIPRLVAICVASVASLVAAADEPTLVPYRQPTNFYGEADAKFHCQVVSPEAFAGRVVWRLSASNRTIAARETPIELDAGEEQFVEFEAPLPPVKEGVVFPLELQVSLIADDEKSPAAESKLPIYLFAKSPFVDREEWLESLEIQVFDPEGDTLAALSELEVPHDELTNLATLEDLTGGVLIVGEGVDWSDYGELGAALFAAAQRGVWVICLAPKESKLPMPLGGHDAEARSLSLHRTNIIKKLDKRLSLIWSRDKTLVRRSLECKSRDDSTVATAVDAGAGWPWLEVHYDEPRGALVWCGFGVIQLWNESPAPRYFLARLLEQASPASESDSNLESEETDR